MYPRIQLPIALSYTTVSSNIVKCNTQNYVNYHHQKNILPLFLIYEIKSKIFCGLVEHDLKKSFTMTIPMFVDLQGFIIGKKFVV